MNKNILFILSLMLVLGACAPAAGVQNRISAASAPEFAPQMDSAYAPKEIFMEEAMEAPAAPPSPAGMGVDASAPDQLVIQNASLSILVRDPAKDQDAIAAMAKELGGYVVTSNLYKYLGESGIEYPEATITIRVPAGKLDETLARIKAMVEDANLDILSENRSGQNVTKEYTDLKSRLTNLEQAEAQLREIMASATKTEDVLAVFNQLTQIREQIEVIKGQMKYYEESAAMSAVDIRIKSKESVAPLTVAGWQPQGVARDALQALIDALKFIVNLLIWIIIFLIPILIIIILPVWAVIRAIRRSRAKKKAAAANQPASKE
jgi:archaellum component FlaC